MPSVNEILEFLRGGGGIEITWSGETEWLRKEIVGVSTDGEAGEGDLAWISSKQAKAHPERLESFGGSLLIGPGDAAPEHIPMIACDKPKLAFILVVDEFFSDLAHTTWPAPGEHLSPDARIADDAVLASGVVIGSGVIIDSGAIVGPNTVIANCTINRGGRIGANCSIGLPGFGFEKDENGKFWRFPHIGRVIIEEDVEIGSNTCVDRGSIGDTVIGRGVKIDNLVHVAHNVTIGPNSLVIANSMLGGSAAIGENVWVAPSASLMNQVSVGKSAVLGLGAVVLKDVEEAAVMVGNPARLLRKEPSGE
jgi:UDP-3-O-[3-hydroxymyristoyl] glucosamine N-acyltransferase